MSATDCDYELGAMVRPVVLIAVEPPLLESTLGRLLSTRGWSVLHASENGEIVDAVVVSQELASATYGAARLTIVLPDECGVGGSLTHMGQPAEPLSDIQGSLDALLELLQAGSESLG